MEKKKNAFIENIDDVILTVGGLVLYAGFEYLSYKNPEFGSTVSAGQTRGWLQAIVGGLFGSHIRGKLPQKKEEI